jgi:hypothetical protein
MTNTSAFTDGKLILGSIKIINHYSITKSEELWTSAMQAVSNVFLVRIGFPTYVLSSL